MSLLSFISRSRQFESRLGESRCRLWRLAHSWCRNRALADDLVQDTLERAVNKWGLWRGVGSVRPWLFSIMHNLFVDHCAVRNAQATESLDDLPDAARPVQAATQELHFEALELLAALQRLSVPLREVLLLVAVEGLSYTEAAKALGVPTGTVMSRLSRARRALRSIVEGGRVPLLRRVK